MRRRYALVLIALLCAVSGPTLGPGAIPAAPAGSTGTSPQAPQPSASDFIKSLQRALKRAGYDPGEADGLMGPTTRGALKQFQQAQGLSPTGKPDIPTLTRLLGKDLPR
jgi:peptidoglycan hydrolase-like protein with peptidoglycan-binding domain